MYYNIFVMSWDENVYKNFELFNLDCFMFVEEGGDGEFFLFGLFGYG